MFNKIKLFVLAIALCNVISVVNVIAQRGTSPIQVMVSPVDDDWTYETGDKLEFEIQVINSRRPMKGIEVEYEIMPEKMEPFKEGKETIKKESLIVAAGKIKNPGFVTCNAKVEIDGVEYSFVCNCRIFA